MGGYFYTLCYPEALSESYLRLCRFSIADGSMEMLGDSIPIHSDKIATNANIYYDPVVDKFFVCVQEFTDDISSTISLYSIQLPVLSDAQFAEISKLPADKRLYYIAVALLLIVVAAVWLVYHCYRKRKQVIANNEKIDVQLPDAKPNAIYVFGSFCAFDRKNRDISYLFTDKLRELTCLLLWYHKQGGVSSKLLGTMLWGDKPADKIKNSRSVLMNHMRKVLEEMDGIECLHELRKQTGGLCKESKVVALTANAGSEMRTKYLAAALSIFESFFGANHVLSYRDYLQNAVTSGRATGGAWYNCKVELMDERQVYGGLVFDSGSPDGSTVPSRYTVATKQFALFRVAPWLVSNRQWFWLRNVVSAAYFASVDYGGNSGYIGASYVGGVRPAALIG